MDFRCANCMASQWLDRDEPLRHSDTLHCSDCGKIHEAKPVPALGSTLGSHYRHTIQFASRMQIDVPSAYSVLLQLMTLDELQAIPQDTGTDPLEETPHTNTPQSTLLLDIDPRFARAVAKGHLTEQEALRRGNRTDYARAISRRHRLPMRLAYAVADNRITLRKASLHGDAARELRQPAPRPGRSAVRWRDAALVIGLATAMLGLATWAHWSRNFDSTTHKIRQAQFVTLPAQSDTSIELASPGGTPTRQQALRSVTEVLTDDNGQVTQVIGPDPGNVLRAYCEEAPGNEFFEPTEVTETVPPSREARLGVFRDLQSLTANRTIRIRRDRQSRRWVAGDGVHPIQVAPQPDLPPGALRVSAAAH